MADLQDLVRKKTTTKPKHTQSAFWGVESNSYGQPDIATNNSNVKIKLTLLKIVYIKNYREEKLIVWYGCVYYFKKIGGGGGGGEFILWLLWTDVMSLLLPYMALALAPTMGMGSVFFSYPV